MAHGELLLSRIIDTNDIQALTRYGIERDHFATDGERAAYDFILDYAAANGGKAPDYRTLVAEVDEFTYMAGVEDSTEWLAGRVKDEAGKRFAHALLTGLNLDKNFTKMSTEQFTEWLTSKLEDIIIRTSVRKQIGKDIKKDTDIFLEEYRKRKSGESVKIWPSKFPTINREIGGYTSGNVYTWFGRSGRGKSVITDEEAIEAAMNGANVLMWKMEMGWFESMVRLYVSISGREAVVPRQYTNIDMDAGFDAKKLRSGRLSEDFEAGFEQFLATINEIIPGNIIIRAVDDEDFTVRNLRQLEADIIKTNANVVVIDPFYYLDYEKNTSKTTGGDAAETSKKLRRLAGRTKTVIHAITQADEDAKEGVGDERELMLPKRSEVKKTKQLLEDAALLIAIDTLNHEGRGLIGFGKGRDGGEGTTVEIAYLPNYGIVKEQDLSEQFASAF